MAISRLRQLLHQLNPRKATTASIPQQPSSSYSTAQRPAHTLVDPSNSMAETTGVTDACCAPPAITRQRDGYETKGSYKSYGTLDKAYVTGPTNTSKAIIFVYDIFGFYPTTLQAADLLSKEADALVVMPDFAHGEPYSSERFLNPPEGVEVMQEVGKKFFDPKYMDDRFAELKSVAAQLRSEGKTYVGAVGLCWGGRVVTTAGTWSDKVLDAVSSNHPAMLMEEHIEDLKVPVALFPSKDDQLELAEKIVNGVKAKPFGKVSDFKAYKNMHHGWSGAHAWLDQDENAKEYADVWGRQGRFHSAAAAAA